MKNKRGLLLLTLILAGGGIWGWLGTRSSMYDAHSNPSAPDTAADATSLKPIPSSQLPLSRREQMSKLLGAVNHKSIEFYGKVVDQQGAPLADVTVYASVIYNTGISSGLKKKETTTDSTGRFSIVGMHGRTLGIGLGKEGYEYGGEHGPFQFTELVAEAERHHADKSNPVVFVMWKLQGAEPMIYVDGRSFALSPDGAPVRIDLETGKKVTTGGDLVVTLRQPMAQAGEWLHHYPWTAEISGSGLLESDAALMYLAPETGYSAKLTYGETGKERDPRYEAIKKLYVMTKDGRFARVQMVISSQTNPERGSRVGLTWWLNPKPGSRNLEFDPAKAIKPPR